MSDHAVNQEAEQDVGEQPPISLSIYSQSLFISGGATTLSFAQKMKSLSTRCRLEDMTLPGVCFVLVVTAILTKVIIGLSLHRHVDILDLLIQLALVTGLFYLIVSRRSSLWTIVDAPSGIRLERDGTVLYEGLSSGIHIVDEDRGIMTLQSCGGNSFQFPRRRVFHEVISQIAKQQQPTGEQDAPV